MERFGLDDVQAQAICDMRLLQCQNLRLLLVVHQGKHDDGEIGLHGRLGEELVEHHLMEHIQGPDFPTRGIIMGRSGIRAAYATGPAPRR